MYFYAASTAQAESVSNAMLLQLSKLPIDRAWQIALEPDHSGKGTHISVYTPIGSGYRLVVEANKDKRPDSPITYSATLIFQPANEQPQECATITGDHPIVAVILLLEAVRTHANDRMMVCDSVLNAIPSAMRYNYIIRRRKVQE